MAYSPLAGLTYTPGASTSSKTAFVMPTGNIKGESGTDGSYTKSDIQAAVARALAKEHPAGHHSAAGGLFANLIGDVKDTVTGFVPGLIHTAEHPIATAEAIGKSYKETYAPLLEGHYSQFLHGLYEHPLGPLLDAATVITAGGSAAVRGASLLERAGVITDESRLAKLTTGSERSVRINRGTEGEKDVKLGQYDQNPVIRLRQKAFDKIATRAPQNTPFLGESARATRAIQRIGQGKEAVREGVQTSYNRLAHDVAAGGPDSETAFHHFLTGISPEERHTMLAGEVEKHNTQIEHESQAQLQKVRDAQQELAQHEAVKHMTKTARSTPYPKSFKARKVTKLELANHEGQVAKITRSIAEAQASVAKRQSLLERGAGKVSRGTTRRHEVKLSELQDELAGHESALKKLKANKPKDLPARTEMVTHDTSKGALKSWHTRKGELEDTIEKAQQEHEALQGMKKDGVDPLNDHFLKTEGSKAQFHRNQTAHSLLKEHAGYETGEHFQIQRAIRDSELDEPAIGNTAESRKAHEEWHATHKALEQKLADAGGSPVTVEAAIHITEQEIGHKFDPLTRTHLRARDAAQKLAQQDGVIRKLGSDRARLRRYLHIGLFNGMRQLPNKIVTFTKHGVESIGEEQEDGTIHLLRGEGEKGKPVELAEDEQKTVKHVAPQDAEKLLAKDSPLDSIRVNTDYYHPDGAVQTIERLQAAHDATGRAEPVYFPDKTHAAPEKGRRVGLGGRRNKGVPQAVRLEDHANNNILALAGAISRNPEVLTRHSLASIAAAHATDTAELLRANAYTITRAATKDEMVLKGDSLERAGLNKFIEDYQTEAAKGLKNQDIGALQRNFIEQHLEKGSVTDESQKLVVSKKLVDQLMPQMAKSHNFLLKFYRDFSGLWKQMVLGGRPLPFIVNNVVGNTIMYLLRNMGLRGLHALLKGHNEERMFEEAAAEHHLTHGGVHQIQRPNRLQRIFNTGYNVAAAHEHVLRRSTMVAEAKGDRLVQKAMAKIKEEDGGRYRPELHDNKTHLHAALDRADHENPGLKERIGNVIDDTMGNYRSFSATEDHIRNLMPFYSWTRHSTRAYLKLLMDKPLAAVLVTAMGAQGKKEQDKLLGAVPDFMKSYVPFHFLKTLEFGGKGDSAGIDTSVLNPEKTVADTINTVAGLTTGKPGESSSAITSNLNPLITGLYEQISGKSALTGAPLKGGIADNLGIAGVPARIAEQLPASRLIESILPPGEGGSAANPNPGYTPTGKKKKAPTKTIDSDFRTQGADMFAGIPAKVWNTKGSKEWQQRIQSTADSGEYHVAKKRKSKKSTGYQPLKGLTY